jgi:hypothetical protein
MSEITAEQARSNSQASTYGTSEVLKQVDQAIEANSKTGATSITSIFSKQAVDENELQGAIANLEGRGFTAERTSTTAAHYTLKVSW